MINNNNKQEIVNNVKNKLAKYSMNKDINDIKSALDFLISESLTFTENGANPTNTTNTTNTTVTNTPEINNQQTNVPITPNVTPRIGNETKTIINQMRKMALDGVRALADNPTSEEYQFFKKVWDMTDKAQEAKKDGMQKPSAN